MDRWDEFMHWGVMLKQLIIQDDFYSVADFFHNEYPPFITIFEALWCRLSLGYTEWQATLAIDFMTISFVAIPISEKLKDSNNILKRIVYVLAITIFSLFAISIFDITSEYGTLMIDLIIPIIFAFSIVLTIENKVLESKFLVLYVLLCSITLLLGKQIGIAFFLLLIFALFLNGLKYNNIKIINLLLVIFISVLFWLSWSLYTKHLGLTGQFDLSKISPSLIFKILLKKGGNEIQIDTSVRFIHALFETELLRVWKFSLSYFDLSILFLMIAVIGTIFQKNKEKKRMLLIIDTVFLAGTIGYALTMYILYLFCFPENEMAILSSYSRYMSSYLLSEFLIILYFAVFDYFEENKNKKIITVVVLCLLTVFQSATSKYKPELNKYESDPFVSYRNVANTIIEKCASESRVLILVQDDYYKLIYYKLYMPYMTLDADNKVYYNLTIDSLSEETKNDINFSDYDYIYVCEANEYVHGYIKQVIDEDIKDYSCYKIVKNESKISFKQL